MEQNSMASVQMDEKDPNVVFEDLLSLHTWLARHTVPVRSVIKRHNTNTSLLKPCPIRRGYSETGVASVTVFFYLQLVNQGPCLKEARVVFVCFDSLKRFLVCGSL